MGFIQKVWYTHRHPLAYLLVPLGLIFSLIVMVRSWLYRQGLKKVIRFSVPVIVVGNITVGGTGKTPLVIALANDLKQQGFKPGIVSCGYKGRKGKVPQLVVALSNPKRVGDEAVMMARRTSLPVVVADDRVAAVKALLNIAGCDIVISDDGLQHYAMGRDIEIAVIDGERRFGNGFHLPAGPLRESRNRLKYVDFIVVNGKCLEGEFEMQLIPEAFCQINHPSVCENLDIFREKQVHAVAGIGNPNRFFNSLRCLHIKLLEHIFPDHHSFKQSDICFQDDLEIVMTEKDAVKCRLFTQQQGWFLKVNAKLSEKFNAQLMKKLKILQKTPVTHTKGNRGF